MMCTMIDRSTATSAATPPKGKSTVKLDFAYDGGNRGAGGTATLYINGESVGSTRIEPTEFAAFSAGETSLWGRAQQVPVPSCQAGGGDRRD